MSHGSEKVNFCCKQCRCFKGEREAAYLVSVYVKNVDVRQEKVKKTP